MCDIHDRAITCVFCGDLQTLMFSDLIFYEKICLREGEVWWKVFSNKINYYHACHKRFAVFAFSPPLSCCVSSLMLLRGVTLTTCIA